MLNRHSGGTLGSNFELNGTLNAKNLSAIQYIKKEALVLFEIF
jgi:hypothetical protein